MANRRNPPNIASKLEKFIELLLYEHLTNKELADLVESLNQCGSWQEVQGGDRRVYHFSANPLAASSDICKSIAKIITQKEFFSNEKTQTKKSSKAKETS